MEFGKLRTAKEHGSKQMLVAKITNLENDFEFALAIVYGSNDYYERLGFWNEIILLAEYVAIPLSVVGYFNNVLYSFEGAGGEPVKNYEIEPFLSCIS